VVRNRHPRGGPRPGRHADPPPRGYDPQDPESVTRYLQAADSFNGDDWYPWHSEFSEHARHIDADHAEISSVTIEP
jgi:hypothetical protein